MTDLKLRNDVNDAQNLLNDLEFNIDERNWGEIVGITESLIDTIQEIRRIAKKNEIKEECA